MVSTGLHVIGQIKARFPEVEFLGSTSKYKKEQKIGVYVLYNMSHWNVSRFSRAVRNVQKSIMHVQSCSFSDQTYCFFDVPVAIGVVVALTPWYSSETIIFTGVFFLSC